MARRKGRGNRRLNAALHRIAITQMRCHEPARLSMRRKRAEGKRTREGLRCLKRHLASTVWQAMRSAERDRRPCSQTATQRLDLPCS